MPVRQDPTGSVREASRRRGVEAGGTLPSVPTETLTPVEAPQRETTDDGDHDRFAHYAKKADIARAYVTGEAIVALCGKKWVPSRDPSRYPICPTCAERKAAGWRP